MFEDEIDLLHMMKVMVEKVFEGCIYFNSPIVNIVQ